MKLSDDSGRFIIGAILWTIVFILIAVAYYVNKDQLAPAPEPVTNHTFNTRLVVYDKRTCFVPQYVNVSALSCEQLEASIRYDEYYRKEYLVSPSRDDCGLTYLNYCEDCERRSYWFEWTTRCEVKR